MPRLPTADDLGVRPFQDRSSVVTPSVNLRGQNALVETVSNISNRMNERLDASSLHKAKIHFQKAKLEADAAFDQDPDFETYQQRYDEKLKSAMEQASKMVRNPNDRDVFSRDMDLYKAEGTQRIIAKAFNKEVERGIADLDETMTIGRENYLRASNQQDKQFAIDTINEAINSAEKSTHINAAKAQDLRQKFAVDLAVASVEAAPPEKQIKLLNSSEGVMQYLPLDMRKKMLENAETQYSSQVALNTANQIRQEGGTLEERMAKVHKITDPKVKEATRSQVINDHNLEVTAEGEKRYAIYDSAAKALIAGESLDALKAKDPKSWNALSAKEQSALIKMAQKKTPTETNFSVYHNLNILKAQDKTKAYHYFLDNVSSFSASDAKKESDFFTSLAEEPKPLFSMKEMFNRKAKQLEIKDPEELGQAEYRIQEEFETWTSANPGKKIGFDEQTAIVNSVFDKVVGSKSWWLGSEKRGYELPRDKVDRAKLEAKFSEYSNRYGKAPDTAMQIRIHDKMVRDGLIQSQKVNQPSSGQ